MVMLRVFELSPWRNLRKIFCKEAHDTRPYLAPWDFSQDYFH